MARLLSLLLLLLSACAATPDGRWNVDRRGIALGGYDPVSYHRPEGPQPGKPFLTAHHDGANYQFTSEESRLRFLQSPEYYAPRYGGWCAYAMVDGEKVEVDPTCFLLTEEGLFLFYRSLILDTKERWERAGHAELKAEADARWDELEKAEALLRAAR